MLVRCAPSSPRPAMPPPAPHMNKLLLAVPLVIVGLVLLTPTLQPVLAPAQPAPARGRSSVNNQQIPSAIKGHSVNSTQLKKSLPQVGVPASTCNHTKKVLEAMMSPTEQRFLSSFITPVSSYFEWGSGGSTDTYARLTSGTVVSVENYREWCHKVSALPLVQCRQTSVNKLHYKCIVPRPTVALGYPADPRHNGDFGEYISAIADHPDMDVVLVDGRWRVACALTALRYISDQTVVLLHDVGEARRYYDAVFRWYDVIGRADTLVAMRRKKNTGRPTAEELNKYMDKPQ